MMMCDRSSRVRSADRHRFVDVAVRTAGPTKFFRFFAFSLFPVFVFPARVTAQSRPATPGEVRVVTIDGTQHRGTWAGASRDDVTLRVDGKSVRVARDDLMFVVFAGAAPASQPAVTASDDVLCRLANGSAMAGRLLDAPAGQVRLHTERLGDLTMRFSDLLAVRFAAPGANAKAQAELDRWIAKREPGSDVLIVARDGNVTAVRGAVQSLGAGEGTFSFGGRTLPIRRDTACAIVFGAGLTAGNAPAYTVTLRDGSVVMADLLGGDASGLRLDLVGIAAAVVPIDQVAHVQVRSPRVVFASDLPPVEAVFEPFLATPWPHRMDRSVANRPLRLDGEEYVKGIGVHSRSVLVFATEGAFKRFAAVIGIDDFVRPRGSVVFRVLVDEREAFASGPVAGKDPPRPILVDVAGAKRVSLIVEYGEELDLADQADWANARFIR